MHHQIIIIPYPSTRIASKMIEKVLYILSICYLSILEFLSSYWIAHFNFRHIIRSYDCREMEPLPKSYENGVEEELSILDPNPFDIYFSLLLPFSFNQCVCWRDVCKVIFHLFNQVKMILIIKSCWVKNKYYCIIW